MFDYMETTIHVDHGLDDANDTRNRTEMIFCLEKEK